MTSSETTALRARTPDDAAALVPVLRAVHESDGYPVLWPQDPAGFLLGRGDLGAWVAGLAGVAVGQVALTAAAGPPVAVWERASGLPAERLAAVGRLLVAPHARGRGLGRALLEQAAGHARMLGLQPALDVVRGRGDAPRLYAACGWRAVGSWTWTRAGGQVMEVDCWLAP